MEKGETCSFFGHRDITVTDALRKAVCNEIANALHAGCRIFLFGGFGAFDDFCYQTVTDIQKQNPKLHIQRVFCVTQERILRKKQKYFNNGDYEDIVYLTPAFTGWYKSIYFRNLAMIDNSVYVIFYTSDRKNSGSYKAYRYAIKQKGKSIVNLYGS